MKFSEDALKLLSDDTKDLLERFGLISLESFAPTEISFNSDQSVEFLKHIQGFIECRDKSQAMIDEIDPDGKLASLVLDSKFDPKDESFRQKSLECIPVQSLDELYKSAEKFTDVFKSVVTELAANSNSSTDTNSNSNSNTDTDSNTNTVETIFALLKGKERAEKKAHDDYSSRKGTPVSWIYDIVRGSAVCHTSEQLQALAGNIQEHESIEIVKAKNRFKNPTLSGYRDMNLCLRLYNEEQQSHVCELQIHIKNVKQVSEELHSHSHYEFLRKLYAGGTASIEERMEELE